MDQLGTYFPTLLDTSNIVDQLSPIELNPSRIEQDKTDRIKDT